MRVKALLIGACSVLLLSCGYGKDTGPKQPKASAQFKPLVDQFLAKCKTCVGDVFQVNLGRPITAAERGDSAKLDKALSTLRTELMQCLTGQGYGNEIQIERQVVEAWLAKTGCPQFAQTAFKAPQCIAIQSVLEEAGYPLAPAGSKPPARPPAKKSRP